MGESRNPAIDALRTAITLLVVVHHSVLAYAAFGYFDRQHPLWSTAPVVDARRWAGFDVLILFNDGWFMAAMFAIAGLFVQAGLRRHGPAGYLRRRAIRRGVPFVLASLVIMPLAYYPSAKLAGWTASYRAFWSSTVTHGPWSAGPAWFLWVLLAFDAAAAALWTLGQKRQLKAHRAWMLWAGAGGFVLTELALLTYGPEYWFAAGPFAIQASRVGLYGAAFALGVLGGPNFQWRIPGQPMAALAATLLFGAVYLTRPYGPVQLWRAVFGVVLTGFCFTIGCSAFASAKRLPAWSLRTLQRIGPDAFWIYVVHYLPLTWLQYTLLEAPLPAPIKAAIVFGGTLAVSWAAAACLRMTTIPA